MKFTWHLYAKPGDQLALHALASPSATIDVDVRPASAENIAAVRAGMEAVLARKDHTWEEEVLIVNSIAHTRHKEFLPIALSLLSSRRGPWVHVELRPYIYEWSKASAEIRAELFKYLRDHGTKTDAIIFARWKEDNASLSDQELRMLFDSQDIWIKVLTYQTFGHKLAPGYRESLKREIKALQEAIPM